MHKGAEMAYCVAFGTPEQLDRKEAELKKESYRCVEGPKLRAGQYCRMTDCLFGAPKPSLVWVEKAETAFLSGLGG